MNTLGLVLVGVGVLLVVGGIAGMIVGRRTRGEAARQGAMMPSAQTGYYDDWAADGPGGRTQTGSAMVVGALLTGVGVVLAVSGGAMVLLLSGDRSTPPAQDVVAEAGEHEGDPSAGWIVPPTDSPDRSDDGDDDEVSEPRATREDDARAPRDDRANDAPTPRGDRGDSGSDARSSGDLGLAVPMSRPSCDGRGIVVLYSAVTPGAYASEIRTALANNPGSSYLRTDQSCPSLRARDDNGNVIYAVYRQSGYSHAQLCSDVAASPAGSYGRWLDLTSDPSQLVQC